MAISFSVQQHSFMLSLDCILYDLVTLSGFIIRYKLGPSLWIRVEGILVHSSDHTDVNPHVANINHIATIVVALQDTILRLS